MGIVNDLVAWWRTRLGEEKQLAYAAIPALPLEQVRADLKILDLYRQALEAGDQVLWNDREHARIAALEDVIKVRAEAYAGRPGYREEWRPTQ